MRNIVIIIGAVMLVMSGMTAASLWPSGVSDSFAEVRDEHEGHEEAGEEERGHDEHEDIVRIGDDEIKIWGIEVASAGPGQVDVVKELSGMVTADPDRLAHVTPGISGIVHQVKKTIGDSVRRGEVMAVLSSRELADAKSAYLAARERLALAKADFSRQEKLWKKKVTAEKNYLRAGKELAEARINFQTAGHKLAALGLSQAHIKSIGTGPDISFARYDVTAPFPGKVVERHIAPGRAVREDAELFLVADLSAVWVNLNVYQKDLLLVREGQSVLITAGEGSFEAEGKIGYVGRMMDDETRTAAARVALPNPEGFWRPGMFVSGRVAVDSKEVPLLVPKESIQNVEGRICVFVKTDEGFVPRPVSMGLRGVSGVEITSGLESGEMYVTKGAFSLKAQLAKGEMGGHAH